MNRKQFGILVVLVLVLGGAGLWLYLNNTGAWRQSGRGMGQKLLPGLPVTNVAAITVRAGTNELSLVRKGDLWRVAQRYDYPANFTQIRNFVLKARDLKAAQIEEIGPSQLGRFKLLPPGPATNTGVLIEFKDAGGKVLDSLLLGKEHKRKGPAGAPQFGEGGDEGYPDGRYVMVGTNSRMVALLSDPLGDMDVKPEQWLSKDFFKVDKTRSITVAFPNTTNSWGVSRGSETGAEWKLADAKAGEQLDPIKTSGFSYALSSPTFADVLSADTAAPTGLDKPTVITLNTSDGFTYTIKAGAKTNDNQYLTVTVSADLPKERTPGKDEKPADKEKLDKEFKDQQKLLEEKLTAEKAFEKWVYLVSSWTLEPVLKERSQLFPEKKEEPATDAVESAAIKLDAIPTLTFGTNAPAGEPGN